MQPARRASYAGCWPLFRLHKCTIARSLPLSVRLPLSSLQAAMKLSEYALHSRAPSTVFRLSSKFQSEDRKRPIKLAQVSSPGIIIKLLAIPRHTLDYNAPSAYAHAYTYTHTRMQIPSSGSGG
jgi:hypothetical protein